MSRCLVEKVTKEKTADFASDKAGARSQKRDAWPVTPERKPLNWYPARYCLIKMVQAKADSFVLPPAVVRKASWRE